MVVDHPLFLVDRCRTPLKMLPYGVWVGKYGAAV